MFPQGELQGIFSNIEKSSCEKNESVVGIVRSRQMAAYDCLVTLWTTLLFKGGSVFVRRSWNSLHTPGILSGANEWMPLIQNKRENPKLKQGDVELRKTTANVSGFLCFVFRCAEKSRTSSHSLDNRAHSLTGFGPAFEETCQLHVQWHIATAELLIRETGCWRLVTKASDPQISGTSGTNEPMEHLH